jgi:hypothetical protein
MLFGLHRLEDGPGRLAGAASRSSLALLEVFGEFAPFNRRPRRIVLLRRDVGDDGASALADAFRARRWHEIGQLSRFL